MLYLPKAAATALEISYGDVVGFYVEKNRVVIRKVRVDDDITEKEK